jgi:hypothetical protein
LAYLARLMGIQLNNTQLDMFDFPWFFELFGLSWGKIII